jgi:hypothetical protein
MTAETRSSIDASSVRSIADESSLKRPSITGRRRGTAIAPNNLAVAMTARDGGISTPSADKRNLEHL